MLKFAGIKATCCRRAEGKPGIQAFNRGKPTGIERRPGFISWNGNTGASAINVAYHLGVTRIILLGFDMRPVDQECNWHDEHKHINPNAEKLKKKDEGKTCYGGYLKKFPEIAKDVGKLGIEVLNATPDSALADFPIVELKDVLADSKNVA